ncbi:MAG: CapA family protein [Oscillospiraceae bacterium]|nr:CapA family protein [Oscillospiraceae bacterium]
MKLKPIYLVSILLALVLAVAPLALPAAEESTRPTEDVAVMAPTAPTTPAESGKEAPTEGVTEISTEPATEAPTEPQPTVYTLSFVGDCTLGCTEENRLLETSFASVVGENYDYPLANVRHIFEADDFTLANLEGPLTEGGIPMEKDFAFRGAPAYTAILSGASVEAVSNSNNHYYDYGEEGMRSTREALDAAGIAHAWRDSFLYTTDSGLTIGVYCDDFSFEREHMETSFAALREQGAEVIVCAFHWGEEREYAPDLDQTTWGHIAIDSGADVVVGHHPHVLQPIEYYGGGVICYSLGNFCYGGSSSPTDKDTAIVQQQFVRQDNGTLAMGQTIIIPCSVSSVEERNNYQPTPMAEGSDAYQRVLEKLTFTE